MTKKTMIFLGVFIVALIGAIIKMVSGGSIQWTVVICSLICAVYGTKRLNEDSVIGEIVMGLCILLMGFIIFDVSL